ncbi:MAG TPA: gephyrin-like molybdotransferase Glp [Fimbriimonas sp.]|nr:gephyrin-like molybdotransferase Glp [Fimbriimonas sp.]
MSYEEALAAVLSHVRPGSSERVALGQLLDRVLAQPIVAPIDLPPFDNSSVDGYAICHQEFNDIYHEVGELAAGSDQNLKIDPGETVRVFTGSPLPWGTTAVAMQEEAMRFEKFEILLQSVPEPGECIRRKGEELAAGEEVFASGTIVTPPVLGMLATLGFSEAVVARLPSVAVIGTGSELVSPGQSLGPAQVYESNTYGVQAALLAMGIASTRTRVLDDEGETVAAFEKALSDADVLIVCGGVSVGAYDLVRPALSRLGFEERVWRVRIKPGKPFYFGTRSDDKLVFGLPGNPVSALVVFALLVRPALLKMLGADPVIGTRMVTAGQDFPAAKVRDEFLRGKVLEDGSVVSLEAQGSHMLSGLALAGCLVRVMADQPAREGELVEVIDLYWRHAG